MMLDVGLLKGVSLLLRYNNIELFELYFSRFSRYVIVKDGKILYKYLYYRCAERKFNKLVKE